VDTDGLADDRPDRGIESRAIAAAGEDADTLQTCVLPSAMRVRPLAGRCLTGSTGTVEMSLRPHIRVPADPP
jgi:hypothetical protein